MNQFNNEIFSRKISTPLLSILIPTYDYSEGLVRILTSLGSTPNDIEVLVFDDSPSLDLKKIVDNFSSTISNLTYRHNFSVFDRSLGAGNNWNSLLDAASGEYVVVMHHDEYPLGFNFISNFRSAITKKNPPDVLLFDLILVDDSLGLLPHHAPKLLRWLTTKFASGYLFRRNVIGPSGTLAMRKLIAPRFDSQLRWLIDVEFYVKLCRTDLLWSFVSSVKIVSVQRKSGTITNELAEDLVNIDAQERLMLKSRYPNDHIWLGGVIFAPIRLLEFLFWIFLRAGLILLHSLSKIVKGQSLDYR